LKSLRAFWALIASAVLLQGCVHGMRRAPGDPGNAAVESQPAASSAVECTIEEFARFEFSHRGEAKPVYQYGAGPGVLILHEIDGLTPETLCLAKSIAAQGYSVFVPLFFGKPGQKAGGPLIRTLRRTSVCLGHDFCCFCKDRSSPVVGWLSALLPEIGRRTSSHGIGVIGMCLTGTVPVALMGDPIVKVAVLSQPSLPLPWTAGLKPALGLSGPEIKRAQDRAPEVEMIGFRFAGDTISPPEKFEALEGLFGKQINLKTFPAGAHGHSHAVLTVSFQPRALAFVLDALQRGLKTRRSPEGSAVQTKLAPTASAPSSSPRHSSAGSLRRSSPPGV
jgi:dienelactone hydrolase